MHYKSDKTQSVTEYSERCGFILILFVYYILRQLFNCASKSFKGPLYDSAVIDAISLDREYATAANILQTLERQLMEV